MKKLLASSLCAALFLSPMAFAEAGLATLQRNTSAWANDSANATVTVVPASSGVIYTILGVLMSVSSADNLTLKCGTRQVMSSIYLGANSGFSSQFVPLYIRCNAGEAVNVTKGTATTPVGVTVWFDGSNP